MSKADFSLYVLHCVSLSLLNCFCAYVLMQMITSIFLNNVQIITISYVDNIYMGVYVVGCVTN